MQKFWHDTRGVYAIEFAVLFPLIIICFGWGFNIAQHQQLNNDANFLAQACTVASVNYSTNSGASRQSVEPRVVAMLTASFASLQQTAGDSFYVMDAPVISYPGTLTTCRITLHTNALFEMLGRTLSSTAEATQ